MPVVRGLARFPVKSCGAEATERLRLGVDGPLHDRMLAVVVGDDIVTQREHAVLATVRPRLDDDSMTLRLSVEGGSHEPVAGVVRTEGPRRTVRIFGEPVEVVEQSPDLSGWFAQLLGLPARLAAAPPTTRRSTRGPLPGLTVLADEATVSLHSLASLARLNQEIAGRGAAPLPADRFRANIVIDDCASHAEDAAQRIEVGDEVVLRLAGPDPRCVVTTVDQRTGRRAGPEPIRSLSGYRRGTRGGVLFGVYLTVEHGGVVHVGDRVLLDGC